MLFSVFSTIVEVAIVAGVIVFAGKNLYDNAIAPHYKIEDAKQTAEIHDHAIVMSKVMGIARFAYGRNTRSSPHISFELSDGTRKDFEVDIPTYNMLIEGEEGILTYKQLGDTRVFVSFQRTR